MGRVLGLPLLLVALAVGGYLFVVQTRGSSPSTLSPQSITQDESRATAAVAAANLQGAGASMQAWFAANNTYAGATLPPGSAVFLVRADTSGYCLQAGAGPTAIHELGPGGQPTPGPC